MQPTYATLVEMIRTRSSERLSQHLPASIDLRTQAKQACSNERGPELNLFALLSLSRWDDQGGAGPSGAPR